ncbi:MAG: TolC family protein [Ferruginibacter sp.]|nr:TolC family protein [Cytophagales bacterium]
MKKTILLILLVSYWFDCRAQTVVTLDSALAYALKTHPQMRLSQQQIDQQRALKRGSLGLPNTELLVSGPAADRLVGGFLQAFDSPFAYVQQSRVARQNIQLAESGLSVNQALLTRDVRLAYLNLQFAQTNGQRLAYQDSIFNALSAAAQRRYQAGDADLLERVSAETRARETRNALAQAQADLQNAQRQLQLLTGLQEDNLMPAEPIVKSRVIPVAATRPDDSTTIRAAPTLRYYRQNIALNQQQLKLERSRIFPGLVFGYQNQGSPESTILPRFTFAITVPLAFWTVSSRIKAANLQVQIAHSQLAVVERNLGRDYQRAATDFQKFAESLNYYETAALQQAQTIISAATRSYNAGESSYFVYLQSLNQAFEINRTYLDTVRGYNQSVIELDYLGGQP